MNYELEVSKSLPYSFTALNGDRPPLVAGVGSATLLTASQNITFPAFQAGRKHEPFTLEAWFLPVSYSGVETTVIGHNTEGVMWNGTLFTLRVRLAGSVIVEDTWTPLELKSFHVVMTYDTSKVALWIDGEKVIELDVPVGDFEAAAGSNLVLNYRVGGTATGIYDSVATYTRTLTEREIKLHYAWGLDVASSSDIASSKGATTYTLTYADVDILDTVAFDVSNWGSYLVDGLSIADDRLIPDADGGTWIGAFPLGPVAGDTTAGIHLTYEGSGVTLSYSTDGTAWTVTPNKRTVLEGAVATDTQLFLKVELTDDSSWISYLRADVLGSRTMQPFSGNRTLAFKSAAMDQTPGHQLEFQADWGAQVRAGYIEVQPDTADTPSTVRTIEAWAKVEDADGFFLGNTASNYVSVTGGSYSFTGVTAYRNGVAVTNGSFPADEFAHWVFVLTTANNSPIRIGNNLSGNNSLDLTVGHLAVYPQAMTAAEVAKLYSFNVGAPALRVSDTSTATMSEDTAAAQIYAYAWSYVSGGR